MRVDPVAGVFVHQVLVGDLVTALIELHLADMQFSLNQGFVKPVFDSQRVVTVSFIDIVLASALPDAVSVTGCAIIALGVDVEDASFHLAELFVIGIPEFLAVGVVESETAGSLDEVIFAFIHVSMVVEELVLVQRHAITRIIALSGISAGIPDHDALQRDFLTCGGRMLVVFDDFSGEVGNIDSGVAFTRHVEVVVAEFGELLEEGEQCFQVELGDSSVIENSLLAIAESDLD